MQIPRRQMQRQRAHHRDDAACHAEPKARRSQRAEQPSELGVHQSARRAPQHARREKRRAREVTVVLAVQHVERHEQHRCDHAHAVERHARHARRFSRSRPRAHQKHDATDSHGQQRHEARRHDGRSGIRLERQVGGALERHPQKHPKQGEHAAQHDVGHRRPGAQPLRIHSSSLHDPSWCHCSKRADKLSTETMTSQGMEETVHPISPDTGELRSTRQMRRGG